jgi:hypothetical protein
MLCLNILRVSRCFPVQPLIIILSQVRGHRPQPLAEVSNIKSSDRGQVIQIPAISYHQIHHPFKPFLSNPPPSLPPSTYPSIHAHMGAASLWQCLRALALALGSSSMSCIRQSLPSQSSGFPSITTKHCDINALSTAA